MTSAEERDQLEVEELAFARQDARLPWLEADDEYEEPGVPASRTIAFVLAAVAGIDEDRDRHRQRTHRSAGPR